MMWLAVNFHDLLYWAMIAMALMSAFVIGLAISRMFWREEDSHGGLDCVSLDRWRDRVQERVNLTMDKVKKDMRDIDEQMAAALAASKAVDGPQAPPVPPPPVESERPVKSMAAVLSNWSGESIKLNSAEVLSRYDRVLWAEALILQLPGQHADRLAWLINYGRSQQAAELRASHNVGFDETTNSARLV